MRPKLVFRTPEFSPAPSRRCASERNIYVLSVRLRLFADLLRQLPDLATVGLRGHFVRARRRYNIA